MSDSEQKNGSSKTETIADNAVRKYNDDGTNLLPHLESLERMMKLPMVEAAWQQGQGVYGKVKGKNLLLITFINLLFKRGVIISNPN